MTTASSAPREKRHLRLAASTPTLGHGEDAAPCNPSPDGCRHSVVIDGTTYALTTAELVARINHPSSGSVIKVQPAWLSIVKGATDE